MRGIAIIGGEGPESGVLRKIARGADLLVAADSGLIAAEEAGLTPDWVLGDMDSLANLDGPGRLEKYPPDRIRIFPHEKDLTDTELALDLLKGLGCGEIWISGGGGGRTVHLFAIRSLFEREQAPDRWFTKNEEIRCLGEGRVLSVSLPPGSLVSVFPLGKGPWEAESTGLKWPLAGLEWKIGSFGISNIAIEGRFEIRSIFGRFLVIMPHEF